MFTSRSVRFASVMAGLAMAFSMVALDHAEARRGGSFGSRGTRTYQSAPATNTAPSVAPVQRSMTPNTPGQAQTGAMNNAAQPQRSGGLFGGFGRSMLGGLMFGGLLGMMMGSGFGGLSGMFGFLLQALLIGGAIFLLLRLFRSRNASAPAAAGPRGMQRNAYDEPRGSQGLGGIGSKLGGLGGALGGGAGQARAASAPSNTARSNPDEIGVTSNDLDTFEKMLTEIQGAYGREDYGTLRRMTTPEMMSYLSEELGQNASKGVKNEVSEISLLQGDVAESWREGSRDYATVAIRYSSIDAMRDRGTGRIVEGDAERASETREVWTFTRDRGGEWQLSAIQEA